MTGIKISNKTKNKNNNNTKTKNNTKIPINHIISIYTDSIVARVL